jgi:hypothetical protein
VGRRKGGGYVKGFVLHKNSVYNNWRFDDLWLDR